ncbi:MAG: DUF6122 family protein [Porticoccus sp.]
MFLHFLVPVIVSGIFFRQNWKVAYWVMVATMLVDVDHLLATPIYDPSRCSIGFHPLHEFIPIALYVVFCAIPKLRYVGVGLVVHMVLDTMDCQFTNGIWFV